MTLGLSYWNHECVSWSALFPVLVSPFLTTFLNFFSFLSHFNFFSFHYYPTFLLHPSLPISFPQNASLSLVSLCLFYTIPNTSKCIGSCLLSQNNPLKEVNVIVNVIVLINNSNRLSHKYLNDGSTFSLKPELCLVFWF